MLIIIYFSESECIYIIDISVIHAYNYVFIMHVYHYIDITVEHTL